MPNDAATARANFSHRFNEALDDLGVPPKGKGRQEIVGEMFDVSQKGARKWLEGEAIPKSGRHEEFCEKLDVSYNWLFAGNGPKRMLDQAVGEETPPYMGKLQLALQTSTPEARKLADMMLSASSKGQLTDEELKFIRDLIKKMIT